jgi:hypothetical protein
VGNGVEEMRNDDIEETVILQMTGYDPQTGEITQVLEGPKGILVVPDDTAEEAFIEGYGDDKTQKVVNGQIVDKDASTIEAGEIEEAWDDLYDTRTKLLYTSDWTQVPDAPVDAAAWAAYRQELRDLPGNTPDPRYVVWPTPPPSTLSSRFGSRASFE